MALEIDNAALAAIARNAGALPPLPALDQPPSPALMALNQRLAQPPGGGTMAVPPGNIPAMPPDVQARVLAAPAPPVPLTGAAPTLGTLATVQQLSSGGLGMPLPAQQAGVAALMNSADVGALAPIEEMPLAPLMRLAFLINLGALLRQRLGVDPTQPDASQRIAAALPQAAPAYGPSVPADSAPALAERVAYAQQIQNLQMACRPLGADPCAPGGVPQLASAIRPLLGVQLPVMAVSPGLLARLSLLSQINQTLPLAGVGPRVPRLSAHLDGLNNLSLPPMAPVPAQQMPTPAATDAIFASDRSGLSRANWNIPPSLPIADSIPGLNALALLRTLGPVVRTA